MKKISRELLPCLKKLAILLILVTSMIFPLGIDAKLCQASPAHDDPVNGSLLEQRLETQKETLTLKLLGVTSYELTEIFHNIVRAIPGVIEARRYHLNLDPDYPRACAVEWQINFTGTTPFALESEIYNRLKEIANNDAFVHVVNGSEITLTAIELETLKAIKPLQATNQTLRFIQTRTFAQNQGYQWPHKQRQRQSWHDCPNRGFE
jgi:hypothetical protein